jgi:hypothetical protein
MTDRSKLPPGEGDSACAAESPRAPEPETLTLPAVPPHVATAQEAFVARVERMRTLYEETAMPVREIARLVDRTESLVYKYARRYGWKARPTTLYRGGRFLPHTDAERPEHRDRRAREPGAAEAAAERCVRAGLISERMASETVAETRALAAAEREREADLREARALEANARALEELAWATKRLHAARRRANSSRRRAPPPKKLSEAELEEKRRELAEFLARVVKAKAPG